MDHFAFELEYYVTASGDVPFREWLDDLDDINARARIRIRLDRMRLGNFGDCKSVGSGVHELRVPYGPGYRVYFAREESRIVLLLLGGDKTSQRKDIARAKAYRADFSRRTKRG